MALMPFVNCSWLYFYSGVQYISHDTHASLFLFQAHVCSLPKVPFRGAPCSDAAGRQVPYATIMKQVNSSLSGVLWDEVQKAPFYEYKVRVFFQDTVVWSKCSWTIDL